MPFTKTAAFFAINSASGGGLFFVPPCAIERGHILSAFVKRENLMGQFLSYPGLADPGNVREMISNLAPAIHSVDGLMGPLPQQCLI